MSEEKKNNQPEKTGLDETRKSALLRYVAILFAVAFVLVLISMLSQMRDSNSTITELSQSSSSAIQKAEQLQETVSLTHVAQSVAEYVVDLVDATRRSELLLRGCSPRATLAIIAMAKAIARLHGRDYVVPRDVQEVFATTTAHRLQLSVKADAQGMDMEQVLRKLLGEVRAPKLR